MFCALFFSFNHCNTVVFLIHYPKKRSPIWITLHSVCMWNLHIRVLHFKVCLKDNLWERTDEENFLRYTICKCFLFAARVLRELKEYIKLAKQKRLGKPVTGLVESSTCVCWGLNWIIKKKSFVCSIVMYSIKMLLFSCKIVENLVWCSLGK